jgi:hypothetical protein
MAAYLVCTQENTKEVMMGQRLVIKIVKDNKVQAALLYTWDGRTLSAFMDARDIVKTVNDTDDLIWQLYKFVLGTTGTVSGKAIHGGVMKGDRDEFLRRYSDRVADANDLTGDGSCGLLAVSTPTIRRMQQDAVMDITLNFDDLCADMNDTFSWVSGSEYRRIYKRNPKKLPVLPFDHNIYLPFSELQTVLSILAKDGGTDYYISETGICYIYIR